MIRGVNLKLNTYLFSKKQINDKIIFYFPRGYVQVL